MKVVELNIGSTPALIIGEKSEKVFLFVHGLHGRKKVTIMPDGGHWFHTPKQLAFLKEWEEKTIEQHCIK